MSRLRTTGVTAAAATAGLLLIALPQSALAQGAGRGGSTGGGLRATSPGSALGRSSGGSLTTGGALGGSLSAPPTSPVTTPSTMPPSAIGTPAPQVAPVAPLTPPTTSTFLGGGGTTTTTPGGTTTTTSTPGGLTTTAPGAGVTATYPGGGGGGSGVTTGFGFVSPSPSPSASESAPSIPGGGVDSFAGCMSFWDAGTHMSKREWAASCRRVMQRLQSIQSELTGKTEPSAAAVMKSELGAATRTLRRPARVRTHAYSYNYGPRRRLRR
jgi:hypothetical protein